jgi:hypothetical protein
LICCTIFLKLFSKATVHITEDSFKGMVSQDCAGYWIGVIFNFNAISIFKILNLYSQLAYHMRAYTSGRRTYLFWCSSGVETSPAGVLCAGEQSFSIVGENAHYWAEVRGAVLPGTGFQMSRFASWYLRLREAYAPT